MIVITDLDCSRMDIREVSQDFTSDLDFQINNNNEEIQIFNTKLKQLCLQNE